VSQPEDLQVRAPGLAREDDALPEVPVRVLDPDGPGLGDADADQGQRAQLIAQPVLARVLRERG
jgi:hypothetical protein